MGVFTAPYIASQRTIVPELFDDDERPVSPFGRVVVGPIFSRWGNAGVWVEIAGGLTVGSLLFIAVTVAAWRSKASESSSPVVQAS